MLFYSISSIFFSTPYFDKARITIYLTNHRNPNTAACSVGSVSSFLAGNGGGAQWHHMFYKIRVVGKRLTKGIFDQIPNEVKK